MPLFRKEIDIKGTHFLLKILVHFYNFNEFKILMDERRHTKQI